jgi:biotin operon repressor
MVDRQAEPFLPSIIVEGKNGYRFHRFDAGTVEAFRTQYVSEQGLSDALGIFRTDLIRRIKDAGVCPVLAPPDVTVEMYRIEDLPSSLRPPEI